MTLMTNLFDDVMDRADVDFLSPGRPRHAIEVHDCDCCGEATTDVDLWAEDSETGEELWLCGACVEW
jgi:hypothetical protein